uniref:Uncharacterized protein n=1 Tax=Meloidogyne javanica TaxID=6303 RepID=A0A915MAY3_MELJA
MCRLKEIEQQYCVNGLPKSMEIPFIRLMDASYSVSHVNLLIAVKVLERVNSEEIARFVNDSIDFLSQHVGCYMCSAWIAQGGRNGLSRAITKLEKQGLPIYDALEIFANVRNEIVQ